LDKLVLISAPNDTSLKMVLRQLNGETFQWAYLGQSSEQRRSAEDFLGAQGSKIEISQRFRQAADTLREPFLEYVFGIAKEVDSIIWWLTSVSYRRDEVSKTFHQSCNLKIALDLANDAEIQGPLVLVIDSEPERRALENNLAGHESVQVSTMTSHFSLPFRHTRDFATLLFRRGYFLAREARRLFIVKRLIRHKYVPTEPTTLLFSTLSRRNLASGPGFHKLFFGDLAEKLTAMGNHVTTVALILREVSYRTALERLKSSPTPVIIPNLYLNYRDILNVAAATLNKPPVPQPLPTLCGMDIGPLVAEDPYREVCPLVDSGWLT